MNIHHDFEKIKMMAIHHAKEHNCNYTVILMNPDENGNFSLNSGSTYEFVIDSYFEKERLNIKTLFETKSLATQETKVAVEIVDSLFPTIEDKVYFINSNGRYDFDMPEAFIRPEDNQPWKNKNKKGRGGNRKW